MNGDDIAPVVVTPTTTDQALILRIAGDIDLATRATADTTVRSAVAAIPPPGLVVVDLTAARFLSAAGARLLTDLTKHCADHNVTVHLVATSHSIAHRVIEVVGLADAVPTFERLDEAIASSNPD